MSRKINRSTMKRSNMKTFIFFLFCLSASVAMGQDKSYKSSKNTVTRANGVAASVTNEKKMYFKIYLEKVCNGNDCGGINVADGPMNTGQSINYEQFRIYSVKLNDAGVYDYWTIDIGNDGQTVLFEVDNNSAVTTITVSRYSPVGNSTVLKRTIYYID